MRSLRLLYPTAIILRYLGAGITSTMAGSRSEMNYEEDLLINDALLEIFDDSFFFVETIYGVEVPSDMVYWLLFVEVKRRSLNFLKLLTLLIPELMIS